MSDKIHNLNALLRAAAKALAERDLDRLEELDAISSGWLQDTDSRNAQADLLSAMSLAGEELESFEEEEEEDEWYQDICPGDGMRGSHR